MMRYEDAGQLFKVLVPKMAARQVPFFGHKVEGLGFRGFRAMSNSSSCKRTISTTLTTSFLCLDTLRRVPNMYRKHPEARLTRPIP